MRWADNVVEQSTTTTTGAYQLGGVPATGEAPGAQGFVAGIGNAQTCYYYAKEVSGTAWERGIGTVTDAATDTLTRTTIHGSSNGGAAVDWTGKTLRVYCVAPAHALRRMSLDYAGLMENITVVASRSAGAETIAVKTLAGTDPSATDPCRVGFAKTDGTFEVLEITAALSLTLSSGSAVGAVNATAFRLWVTLFNDAGTVRIGAVKCALTDGVRGLSDNVQESSTAEGGAGAADSAGVIYTGTAVASKTMRVIGYLEYTLAAAGTWDTAPSLIKLWSQGDKLPGDRIQFRRTADGTLSTFASATILPADGTIPQSGEGVAFSSSQFITPKSEINLLHVTTAIQMETAATNQNTVALFRDSGADAVAAAAEYKTANNSFLAFISYMVRAGTTASTEFKIRAGTGVVATVRFNSVSGGVTLGGTLASYIAVEEIMV